LWYDARASAFSELRRYGGLEPVTLVFTDTRLAASRIEQSSRKGPDREAAQWLAIIAATGGEALAEQAHTAPAWPALRKQLDRQQKAGKDVEAALRKVIPERDFKTSGMSAPPSTPASAASSASASSHSDCLDRRATTALSSTGPGPSETAARDPTWSVDPPPGFFGVISARRTSRNFPAAGARWGCPQQW
jgi:hypothetical protein